MSTELDPISSKPSRGWLWVILGTVAILLIVFSAINAVYFHDEPPPDDADLRVRDLVVPEDQNGLVQLRKLPADTVDFIKFATSKGVDEDEAHKIQDGLSANDTLVDEFLAQAQPAFAKLDDILKLPHFAFNDEISPSLPLPEVGLVFNYAHALQLAAQRQQALGEYPAAVGDVAKMRSLARRLIEGHVPLLLVLTACSDEGIACKVAQKLLDDPALPPESVAELTQEFSREISWRSGLQRSLGCEYLKFVKILETKSQGQATDSPAVNAPGSGNPVIKSVIRFVLKVNVTKREVVLYFRQVRQALDGPYSATQESALAEVQGYIGHGSKVAFWIRPNLAGRYFLDMPTRSIEGIISTIYARTAEDRLLQTACALRHYFDDHHALPGTLKDLIPGYLPTLPHDPFNDEPVHYDAIRGLVYSVGTSIKDSGGSNFLKMSKDDLKYEDPLYDKVQPTLQLGFQNVSATKPQVEKSTNK